MPISVVTGGAGYFGETLAGKLLGRGDDVVVFDLNAPGFSHTRLRAIAGDVRNFEAVRNAVAGASAVYHAVAQVPLAKDASLFWSVNRDGTENVLRAALDTNVERVVYLSSSAVFGRPRQNPVTEETPPLPMEDYGRAKYAGEQFCADYAERGLSVSIIRPRTIVGHGRLGIFQILFEWIHRGVNVPVLGRGDNRYQFVHADDLAEACVLAREAKSAGTYNIGAAQFGTMRETLERLIAHARTKSKVRSVPRGLAQFAMRLSSAFHLSPLAPYHALMYGESLWFDISKAQRELGFTPKHAQDAALAESYDWYVAHRDDILAGRIGGSKHQSALAQGILRLVPHLI